MRKLTLRQSVKTWWFKFFYSDYIKFDIFDAGFEKYMEHSNFRIAIAIDDRFDFFMEREKYELIFIAESL